MKAGAANYIIKENIKRLGPAVLNALGERRVLIEQKRVEEALRVTEEKYRRLVEQIPVAVYIDTGDEFGTKTYLGPQFERITGHRQRIGSAILTSGRP
jgi:PAS domain-containing protein